MEKTVIDYADFAEYDRRQRGIQRHMLAAFLGGLAVGLLGMLLTRWSFVGEFYDPYAYLALAIAVGATASGFGWALLTTFLAAVSTLVAAMGGSALQGEFDFDAIGGSPIGLNVLLVLLVALGLLAYVTRRADGWGDLAAGAISGVLLSDVIDRATPGFVDSQVAFWPAPALVIGALSVGLVLLLRRSTAGRLRAGGVALILAGVFALGVLTG
ncbi:hypothetical protein ACIBG8_51225 [Nonomuraea sp. NPDC050556]|uniref:hypothetical protein n=1 Tax=Nonomuraea sp. NPDC050556 TaxID=3364369 RepID=UPI0037B98691